MRSSTARSAVVATACWVLLGMAPEALQGQALTLGEAAEATLASHPALRGAAARVDEAREEATTARALRLPGVQLDAELTRFQEPMIVAPLHSLDLTSPPRFDETLVQGRLGVGYTLFDGGARGARIDGAEASVLAAGRGREAVEAALLEQVAAAYVTLVSARAVREAAAAQTQAFEEELDRARQQVEAGTAPRVEALRADAALQDARAQLAAAEAGVGLSIRNLARLMGQDPETLRQRELIRPSPPEVSSPPAAAVNPAVERARRAVEAAEAMVAMERGDAWPRLDARAGVLDFGTLTGEHVLEWQAGVQLSWPIFTGGARRASVRRAEARLRAIRADLDETELDAARAVDAAQAAMQEADARVEALEASVTQWTEVVRVEALALDAGSGVQADLLRAQARRFQASAGLARARSDAVLARVSLARARGTLDTRWLNRSVEARR